MTKRFKKRQHCLSWGIKDTVTWEQLNIDETMNLLNNIYEENIKLKIENEQLKSEIRKQSKQCTASIQRFKEENEQLKDSLNFCKENVKRLHDDKKELQEELDYYKTKCGSLETALLQGRRAVDKEKEQRLFLVDMEKQRKMFL